MPETQDKDWKNAAIGRGSSDWLPPEQGPKAARDDAFSTLVESLPDIGTPTNTFGVANCIYVLLMRGLPFTNKPISIVGKSVKPPDTDNFIEPLWAFGAEMNIQPPFRYSKTLRRLIWRCLAEEPKERPIASEVMNQIELVLQYYDNMDDGAERLSKKWPGVDLSLLDPEPRPNPTPPRGNATSTADFIFPIVQIDPNDRPSPREL